MEYTEIGDSRDRASWLSIRRASIGASEIAAVMGESPWGSRLTLYLAKTGSEPPEDDPADTERKRLGLRLESAILDEVADRSGVAYRSRGVALRSVAHPWLTATPDAITTDGEPVEVKALAWGFDAEERETGIPRHYQWQCQAQMAVTGASRCLFGVLVHGQRIVWEWVPRDDSMIARLLVAGAEMWRRVVERDEPPSDGHKSDRGWLSERATEGETVELPRAEADAILADYYTARESRLGLERQAKERKKAEDAATNQLAQMMGTATRGVVTDGTVVEWRETHRKGHTVAPSVARSIKITSKEERA